MPKKAKETETTALEATEENNKETENCETPEKSQNPRDLENLTKLPGTEERVVKVDLTDEELLEAGDRAAELHYQIIDLENEKKRHDKRIKAEIENIEPALNSYMKLLSDRYDEREVECEKYYDSETDEICYVYSGKIVSTQEAKDNDKQVNMFDNSNDQEHEESSSNIQGDHHSVIIKSSELSRELLEAFVIAIDDAEFNDEGVEFDKYQLDNSENIESILETFKLINIYQADSQEEHDKVLAIFNKVKEGLVNEQQG